MINQPTEYMNKQANNQTKQKNRIEKPFPSRSFQSSWCKRQTASDKITSKANVITEVTSPRPYECLREPGESCWLQVTKITEKLAEFRGSCVHVPTKTKRHSLRMLVSSSWKDPASKIKRSLRQSFTCGLRASCVRLVICFLILASQTLGDACCPLPVLRSFWTLDQQGCWPVLPWQGGFKSFQHQHNITWAHSGLQFFFFFQAPIFCLLGDSRMFHMSP